MKTFYRLQAKITYSLDLEEGLTLDEAIAQLHNTPIENMLQDSAIMEVIEVTTNEDGYEIGEESVYDCVF